MKESKYLKAGTVLIPKPECTYPYKIREYIVTEYDAANHATIGDNWKVK